MSNDDQLRALTTQLLQQYQTLDAIVDSLNEAPGDSIDEISVQIAAIKETERELLPLRESFRANNDSLPDELSVPTDKTIELVKSLMPKLAQLEKTTLESAQRLFPKIQENVRAVQMKNAYGAGPRG